MWPVAQRESVHGVRQLPKTRWILACGNLLLWEKTDYLGALLSTYLRKDGITVKGVEDNVKFRYLSFLMCYSTARYLGDVLISYFSRD